MAAQPYVDVVAVDALVSRAMDVFAPCALGGALNDDTVPILRAAIVCGAANNQLAHPGVEKLLADRGILYAPDYVVNGGGLIQVADEIEGFFRAREAARGADLRHHPGSSSSPTPTACRRPSPPTGWPNAACRGRPAPPQSLYLFSVITVYLGALRLSGSLADARRQTEGFLSNLAIPMYRKSHERCLTSSGPAFVLPLILVRGGRASGARPC